MASRLVRVNPVTVNDVLDGHVSLDLECPDRLYLNGYLGQLQVGRQGGAVPAAPGFPVPSPACLHDDQRTSCSSLPVSSALTGLAQTVGSATGPDSPAPRSALISGLSRASIRLSCITP